MAAELERRKLRRIKDTIEENTPKKKKRYYNNPQNKNVRDRREIKGSR